MLPFNINRIYRPRKCTKWSNTKLVNIELSVSRRLQNTEKKSHKNLDTLESWFTGLRINRILRNQTAQNDISLKKKPMSGAFYDSAGIALTDRENNENELASTHKP